MESPKRCRHCGENLSPSAIRDRRGTCKPCRRKRSLTSYRNSDTKYSKSEKGKSRKKVYLRSEKGQAMLRVHNQKRNQNGSYIIYSRGCDYATFYRCRHGRCIICNVPPWTLERYRLGPMQVGHLVPGDASGGFEPMCKKCNRYLGARTLTEKTGREVLRRSRRYWSRLQLRDEAWQHTDVDERGYGQGGVNDSPGRARVLEAFDAERRKHSEGQGGCTDFGGPTIPALGQDVSVVLEKLAERGHSEE